MAVSGAAAKWSARPLRTSRASPSYSPSPLVVGMGVGKMHRSRGERREDSIGGEDFLQQDNSPFGHQAFSLLHFFLGGGVSSSAEEEKSCKMSGFLCVLRRFIFLFTPCSSSFVSPTYSTELLQQQGSSCSLALWAGSLGAGHNLSL